MTVLTDALFLISNAMLIPVIVLLLILFVHALLSLGGFYGLYMRRAKFHQELDAALTQVSSSAQPAAELADQFSQPTLFRDYVQRLGAAGWDELRASKILTDYQDEIESRLTANRVPMRVGPMLGLMGTLIPLGPALTGLATGDIAIMAVNIQVAFATTVVGVTVGGIGFLVYTIKRRWYYRDLAHLDYLVQLNARKEATHAA